jgi:hypothetical protein
MNQDLNHLLNTINSFANSYKMKGIKQFLNHTKGLLLEIYL